MPKKTCPNGHVYDTSIYGDQCPMCPSQTMGAPGMPLGATQVDPSILGAMPQAPAGPADGHTHIATGPAAPAYPGAMPGMGMPDNSGETRVRPQDAIPGVMRAAAAAAPAAGGRTVIRRPGAAGAQAGASGDSRRLVGFLVTYNRNPMGKAYNIYEGRNYIGRDASKCGIAVPDDDQMSGTHMSILFRSVDSKFKFRDEQSSNGTFVNKELLDEGELKNYDIIRVGSTLFIFMAIPIIN